MNFLEAVEALENGECEFITSDDAGYELTLKDSHLVTRSGTVFFGYVKAITTYDWTLVNPRPVMERREVKRWAVVSVATGDPRYVHGGFADEAKAQRFIDCHSSKFANPTYHATLTVVELSGIIEVPARKKVKRRADVTPDEGGVFCSLQWKEIPENAKYFAEWEEEE